MLIEVNGNLINMAKDGKFDVIIHGCNCFNTMGAGIAKNIKREFPEAYQADLRTIKGDRKKLGSVSVGSHLLPSGKTLRVVNAYTQYTYGRGNDFVLDAYISAMSQAFDQFPNRRIGMPLIGCGLAGGEWSALKPILEELVNFKNANVTVVYYEQHRTSNY